MPISSLNLDELAEMPRIDLADERAQSVIQSYHTWLEPRIEAAWNGGKDLAVTRLVGPGEGRPNLSPESLTWVETFRWEAIELDRDEHLGGNWTVYRRPADWPSP